MLCISATDGTRSSSGRRRRQDSVSSWRSARRNVSQTTGSAYVEGQRLTQAASDIFLGWIRTTGRRRRPRLHVRQLCDWKASVDVETITAPGLAVYAQACAWARHPAHTRSGDRIAIASYLGKSDAFDRAIADFAAAYCGSQ